MDQNNHEKNWDPGVKRFFQKIINSISLTLLWMISCGTAGIYFELGYFRGTPVIYTIIFYTVAVITLLLLIRYLVRTWSKQD